MPEERSEKTRAIDLALTQIEKQFGKGSIMRLGAKDALVPVDVIPTGAISFDAAVGIGAPGPFSALRSSELCRGIGVVAG